MIKIILIFAVFISVCNSADKIDTTEIDLNTKIKTCLRCYFSCIRGNEEYNTDDWIKNNRYDDTVYKDIPKCIADCATYKGEFAKLENIHNNDEEVGIIEFSILPINYTQANWNALVLYNYVAQLLHKCILDQETDDVLYSVGEKIKKHYKSLNIKDLNHKINKAVSDIREYAKTLHLTCQELEEVIDLYKNKDLDEYMPYYLLRDKGNVRILSIQQTLEEIIEYETNHLSYPEMIYILITDQYTNIRLMKNSLRLLMKEYNDTTYHTTYTTVRDKIYSMMREYDFKQLISAITSSSNKTDEDKDVQQTITQIYNHIAEQWEILKAIASNIIEQLEMLYVGLYTKEYDIQMNKYFLYQSILDKLNQDGVYVYTTDNEQLKHTIDYMLQYSSLISNDEYKRMITNNINELESDIENELQKIAETIIKCVKDDC